MTTITAELGRDWGTDDISEEERAAYAAQVLAALKEEYPEADVEVTHGELVEHIDCTGVDREEVRRIVNDVWDRGGFWGLSELLDTLESEQGWP